MANPGYPMQQQPPQMQPQPQPAHAVQPAPVRRGTSKIVPIVVSAGLAVGTFCGLLFGVGTGEPADASTTSSSGDTKKDPAETKPATPAKPAVVASTPPAKPATPTPAAGSAVTTTTPAAAGSAAKGSAATTPAAGSAAAGTTSSAGTAKPTVADVAVRKPKLTVELTPASAASTAKITIDGKPLEGSSTEIDLGKAANKQVKIVVKASGYKTVEQKVEVDSDVAVKIELIKRPASGSVTGPRPGGTPPAPPKKKPPGGGGLIDI